MAYTTSTTNAGLSFLGGTVEEDQIDARRLVNNGNGANKTGNITLNHGNVTVSEHTSPPKYTDKSANNFDMLPSDPEASLKNAKVKKNKFSKITWPLSNKTNKYGGSILAGAAIGFAVTGGNPVGLLAGMGIGLLFAMGAHQARNIAKGYGAATICKMADEAVAAHIKDPHRFQSKSKTERAGQEIAFLHCRDALQSLAEGWVKQRKVEGIETTGEYIRKQIDTWAKQLGDGLDWDKLVGAKDRGGWLRDELKGMATDDPQMHMAARVVADHLRPTEHGTAGDDRAFRLLTAVLNDVTTHWATKDAKSGMAPSDEVKSLYMTQCAERLATESNLWKDCASAESLAPLTKFNLIQLAEGAQTLALSEFLSLDSDTASTFLNRVQQLNVPTRHSFGDLIKSAERPAAGRNVRSASDASSIDSEAEPPEIR